MKSNSKVRKSTGSLTPFNLIHYTNSTSRDAQKSEHFTLVYWGFPLPQTWHDGDETKQVNHWYWSFYGDPKADRVLVIHNTIDYGSERSFDFLSCRDGRTIQIDRRRGEGRRLFLAARKRIGATHDGHGYHVDGQTFYSLDTYWLRRVVAKIANEEYRKAVHPDTGTPTSNSLPIGSGTAFTKSISSAPAIRD